MQPFRHPTRQTARRTAIALGCSSILLLLVSCENDSAPTPAPTPSADVSPTTPVVEQPAEEGVAAIWRLSADGEVSESSTLVRVNVKRLGCNSGVTGEVLEPTVEYDNSWVVITFQVEPVSGFATCPGNKPAPYEVALAEPIGDRVLIDGQCMPGGEARRTEKCSNNGVRSVVY